MSNNTEPIELLTFEEFIDELGISESFGYKLLSEGTIQGIKLGKKRGWRIPRQSINEYIWKKLSHS